MTYFAAALSRTDDGWTGREFDLEAFDDLEQVAEELRELSGDEPAPSLLLIEENDEYVAIVRVDGGVGSLEEPRVFLSDRRAVQGSDVAALLWDEPEEEPVEDDDDDEGIRPVAEPVGDAALMADFGTPAQELLDLCAEEGLLPADVLSGVAERAGFLDVLDLLREA